MAYASDGSSTRISLIRHGESIVTVQRVIGGYRSCTGLSDLGRRQVSRLASRIEETQELRVDVLLTSHFARAIETAELLRPAMGVAEVAEPWPEFGEQDPGPQIDGMSFDDYVAHYGMPDWDGDPDADIFPGGETTSMFHRRVDRAVRRVLDTYPGGHVAVSCHGGVVDAVLRTVLGLPMTDLVVLETRNASITEFVAPHRAEAAWRLVRYNDAAHLAGLPAETPRAHRSTP